MDWCIPFSYSTNIMTPKLFSLHTHMRGWNHTVILAFLHKNERISYQDDSMIWGIFLKLRVKTLEEELFFSKGLPFLWLYWLYYFLPFCYLKWLIWRTALTLSLSHMHQLILYPPPLQGPINTSNLFYPTSCFSKLMFYLLIQSFSSSVLSFFLFVFT